MTHEPPPPPSWPESLQQPLPGPKPGAAEELRSTPGRGGPGRVTIVLAALALLAVGLVVGLLLRGSGTPSAAATGTGARAGAGNGAVPSNGAGRGEGRFFPGGGGAGGAGGNATQGTISSLSSDGFAMTTSTGQSVTVTIGPNTTVSLTVTGASSGALAVGQPVLVVGTESQGKIAATAVREGALGGFGRNGRPGGTGGGTPPSGGGSA